MENITDVIDYLKTHLEDTDITLNQGAMQADIEEVETLYGSILPTDIKMFYLFADGFESAEFLFRLIPLREIIDNRKIEGYKPLYIAEFLIYSDLWELRITENAGRSYQIVNTDQRGNTVKLTDSLTEFLSRFLTGGIFRENGLYDWQEEIIVDNIREKRSVIAEFRIHSISHIAMRGCAVVGKITSGEVSSGDILYGKFRNRILPLYIKSVEDVRSKNSGNVGLLIECNNDEAETHFRSDIGSTINIYRFTGN